MIHGRVMPKKTRRTPSKRSSGGFISDPAPNDSLTDREQITKNISTTPSITKDVQCSPFMDVTSSDSQHENFVEPRIRVDTSSPSKEIKVISSLESKVTPNAVHHCLSESPTDRCMPDQQLLPATSIGLSSTNLSLPQNAGLDSNNPESPVIRTDLAHASDPTNTLALSSSDQPEVCVSTPSESSQSLVSITSSCEQSPKKAVINGCTAEDGAHSTPCTTKPPSIELIPEPHCVEKPLYDADQLKTQLEQMSVRLLNAQNQIDHLLEEKRSWLEHSVSSSMCSSAPPIQSNAGQGCVGELRGRWLQAKNQAETYKREKEAMVIKYAQSEQKRLAAETRLQELERKIAKQTNGTQHSTPTKSSLAGKPNTDCEPKASADGDFQSRWIQTEKALNAAREQVETLRRGQATAETRLSTLESRLTQAQAALKAEQQKTSSQADTITRLNRSLEAAMKQAKDAERLREREAERLCAELTYQETQERMKRVLAENEELKEQTNLLDSLKTQLSEAEKRIAELTAENTDLMDLHAEVEAGKLREDQLSEFTRRLTERNANLQSEHLVALSRLDELTQKLAEQEQLVTRSTSESATATGELLTRIDQFQSQIADLQGQIEQLRRNESDLTGKLATEREQAQLTHRRDAARIRDLTRQLARTAHVRVAGPNEPNGGPLAAVGGDGGGGGGSLPPAQQQADNVSPDADTGSKLSFGSRTSSLHSLDSSTPINLQTKPIVLGNPLMITGDRTDNSPPSNRRHSTVEPTEPDQMAVLNKLDRLQRNQVRLTDKVEFLQEHCCELNEELNKKSRIIQHLLVLVDKQSGPVSPNSTDVNKDRLARTGGLMASLYTGRSSASAPDRDACLEISQKLQSVVEDTLFKNLTLKDNLSTLGLEISSLNNLIGEIRGRLCPACKSITDQIQPVRKMSFNPVPSAQPLRVNPEPPTFKEGGVNA